MGPQSTSDIQAAARWLLVVEDDALVNDLIVEVLRGAGFAVVPTHDATAARKAITEREFAVAIVDKNLPGQESGLDVLAHLREVQPRARVIMHTGFASKESAIEALRLGAFDYLEKPVDNDLLAQKVERAWSAYTLLVERDELFRKYETLFEIVPGIVWFMTEDGKIKRINREGATMLGYDADELAGQRYDTILAADEREAAAHWAFKERRTGQRATRRQIISLQARAGERRVFEISATGAYDRDQGNPHKTFWGTLGVGWDITDQQTLTEQLHQARKMEAIGRLAGGVAHDFNTLLTVIMASNDQLRSIAKAAGIVTTETEAIEDAARRAADLVRHLLALGRRQLHNKRELRVADALRTLEPLLRRVLNRAIDLELDLAQDLPPIVADPTQLEQVLVNLTTNARDAMSHGGGKLNISTALRDIPMSSSDPRLRPQAGRYVCISVSDSGQGMSEDVKRHLFEPFFTTKGPGAGSGLGMATVYAIVNQADGHVEVDSIEGKGTTVTVLWPAAATPAKP